MIFNLGGAAFETPNLEPNYPKDVSEHYIEGESKSATFEVQITKDGFPDDYTYQWYVDGTAVSGATSSTYTRTGLTQGTHSIYCEVTNAAGTVTSRTATLTVTLYKTPVLNSSYPADKKVTYLSGESKSASFEVNVSTAGVPASYTYQWYVDGTAVSGATGSTYTRTGLTQGTHSIYCKVTNAAGTVTSRTATLTVTLYKTPVLDSNYPADKKVTYLSGESKSASFEVKVSTAGVPASYTYQWYVDGTAVSGATGSTYTRTGLTQGTHSINCKVTNAAGTVTSRTATLTVTLYKTPTLNSSYPANVTQIEKSGGSASFEVKVSTAGVPASYTYQWYVNGSAVSGATSSSYTKTGLTSTGSYTIYCKVTNAAGTVQSRTATLTVQSSQPTYTYSGSHELIKEGTYNWKIKLKTSGKLKFTYLGNCSGLDVFCVGGGGGGSAYQYANASGSGGGGGYTKTYTSVAVETNKEYSVVIGSGGSPQLTTVGGNGGQSYFSSTSYAASGGYGAGRGKSGNKTNRYYGGDGGSGGGGAGSGESGDSGAGGTKGGNGGGGTNSSGGTGQGTSTYEFGGTSGTLYAGGGAGARVYYTNSKSGGAGGGGSVTNGIGGDGTANTGGGGAGSGANNSNAEDAGKGGSGIVVIRNHR